MARAVLIVNPYASAVTEPRIDAVARALGSPEVVRTERGGHATEIARDACGHVDAVYVFSGDGVFNEAVNGADGETPFGFVPGGGSSVLPRALGLPRDPIRAAARIAHGQTRRISLGRANGRRFAFSAGIGLDAELVRAVDALGRSPEGKRPGDLRYAWTVTKLVAGRRARFRPALELAGLGRAAFALVANGDVYTYLGRLPLRFAPLARFEGGLDVVAPVDVTPRSLPRLLYYIGRGRGQERSRDVLYGHDLDRIELHCDVALPLHVDGEDLGDVTEAVVDAERDALTVIA
jgi:diacylglycerol kinase family enzyme